MEQHPVPQHIASFEFKLFGNLTAKQFITLSIPMSIAAIIFFSGMTPIIRLPLAFLIGIFGVFIALVPLGGRSFEKWVYLFIRAIFAPTQRLWIKETQIPEYLEVVVAPPQEEIKIPYEVTAKKREKLMAYVKSLPRISEDPLDLKEKIALDRLGLPKVAISSGNLPPAIVWPDSTEEQLSRINSGFLQESLPQIHALEMSGMEQRKEEITKFEEEQFAQAMNTQPKIASHARPYALPGLEKRLSKKTTETLDILRKEPSTRLASDTNYSTDNVISVKTSASKVQLVHGVGKTRVRKLHFAPPENFDLSKLPIRGERKFDISDELKKRFHFEGFSPDVILPRNTPKTQAAPKVEEKVVSPQALPKATKDYTKDADRPRFEKKEEVKIEEKRQDFSRVAITDKKDGSQFPSATSAQIIPLTSTPNVLSGLVTDKNGLPVEGAVVVVRDSNGIPVRALKTNKLGQFLSATPLASGSYTVEVESDYVKFNPMSINLSGSVVPPYSIKGES